MFFGAALSFLKWLWPFLKESVFKNASFQSWARNNIRTCVWILLWCVMILAILQMADLLNRIMADNVRLQQSIATLEKKHQETLNTLIFTTQMGQSLSQELTWSRHWIEAHPYKPTPTITPTDDASDNPKDGKSTKGKKRVRNQTLIETLQAWDKRHLNGAAPPPLAPVPKTPNTPPR